MRAARNGAERVLLTRLQDYRQRRSHANIVRGDGVS